MTPEQYAKAKACTAPGKSNFPMNELLDLFKKRRADTHSCFLLVQDVLALLAEHTPQHKQEHLTWPIKGARVDGDKVIVMAKGGNDAARWLCGEILALTTCIKA